MATRKRPNDWVNLNLTFEEIQDIIDTFNYYLDDRISTSIETPQDRRCEDLKMRLQRLRSNKEERTAKKEE